MAEYPIQPSDINTDQHFFDAFGNTETEISARFLVRMAQQHGCWFDFTKAEIDEFSGEDFWFNRLTSRQHYHNPPIKQNEDGTYSFTHLFIAKCFLSSPVTKTVTG